MTVAVRRVLSTVGCVVVLALAVGAAPGVAKADAVDEAFQAGNTAAADGDWQQAVESYKRASSLAQHPSATLSYNLGTAYLAVGQLGRATYQLRRALEHTSAPSGEVMERSRYNLQIARRRAELQAAATGAKIDRPETWWDLVLEVLRAQGVAWVSLLAGWAALAGLVLHVRRIRRGVGQPAVTRAAVIVLAITFALFGALHGLAARADRTSPQAVVLQPQLEARAGPGNHHNIEFTLQAGSRVRIVERAPGWRRVRLPGGILGWVPEKAVARLDARTSTARAGAS